MITWSICKSSSWWLLFCKCSKIAPDHRL